MYSNIDFQSINKPFIAMYGGSFNPIHTGHIQLAKYFLNKLNLDKLLLIPDRTPPHKSDKEMVSAHHRFNMCCLSVKNNEKIQVSDIEINREGKSYTIDTLRSLEKLYPNCQLFLIMGADMFLSLHTWKDYKEIYQRAIICAVPRDNDNIDQLIDYSKTQSGLNCIISDQRMMNISSSEIRKLIAQKRPVSGLINEDVEKYIQKNLLYTG